LAACGHPIIGDKVYGVTCREIGRQALHAAVLRVLHPVTKKWLEVRAPLPEDMRALAQACRLAVPAEFLDSGEVL
jgi:hypothetical protein